MNKPIKKNNPQPATGKMDGEQTLGRLTPIPKTELRPIIKPKNKQLMNNKNTPKPKTSQTVTLGRPTATPSNSLKPTVKPKG